MLVSYKQERPTATSATSTSTPAVSSTNEPSSQSVQLALIGTTEKFAFFYDVATRRAVAMALSHIQMIEFLTDSNSPRPRESSGLRTE